MTLTEFLLARIAEDEADASAYPERHWVAVPSGIALADTSSSFRVIEDESVHDSVTRHVARWDPARVLAECDAKRRIVAHHGAYHVCLDPSSEKDGFNGEGMYWPDDPCEVMRLLALPFADHADYEQEWKA